MCECSRLATVSEPVFVQFLEVAPKCPTLKLIVQMDSHLPVPSNTYIPVCTIQQLVEEV